MGNTQVKHIVGSVWDLTGLGRESNSHLCCVFMGHVPVAINLGSHAMDITVKPVLRYHCQERPPVLKDHIILDEDPTVSFLIICLYICHERPPVLKGHIFVLEVSLISQVLLYF